MATVRSVLRNRDRGGEKGRNELTAALAGRPAGVEEGEGQGGESRQQQHLFFSNLVHHKEKSSS
eukprot:761356-Hanusia_phi.AAC.5